MVRIITNIEKIFQKRSVMDGICNKVGGPETDNQPLQRLPAIG